MKCLTWYQPPSVIFTSSLHGYQRRKRGNLGRDCPRYVIIVSQEPTWEVVIVFLMPWRNHQWWWNSQLDESGNFPPLRRNGSPKLIVSKKPNLTERRTLRKGTAPKKELRNPTRSIARGGFPVQMGSALSFSFQWYTLSVVKTCQTQQTGGSKNQRGLLHWLQVNHPSELSWKCATQRIALKVAISRNLGCTSESRTKINLLQTCHCPPIPKLCWNGPSDLIVPHVTIYRGRKEKESGS